MELSDNTTEILIEDLRIFKHNESFYFIRE
jgi:hypothetical protein